MCKKCKQVCKLTCDEKFRQAGNSCRSNCSCVGTTNPRYSTKGDNFNLFGHGRSRYGSECGFGQGTRSRYYDGDFGDFGYGCTTGMGCKIVTSTTVTDPHYRFDSEKFFKPRWCRKNNIEGN